MRAEADQLARACKQGRERERGREEEEGEIERKEPPFPNYSKLFCWMTDFISDQKQGRKTEGGLRV